MREDEQPGQSAAGARMRGPRRWAPIALGVGAGLAICVVAALILGLFHQPASDAAPTARAICADLTAQRYDHLYALLSSDLQAQGSEAQFAASQRELDRLRGPVRVCQVSVASASGGAMSATLSLQRTQTSVARVELTEVAGGWRIASYDALV